MLDYVLETFPEIDKDRVYVMGYSRGSDLEMDQSITGSFCRSCTFGFTGAVLRMTKEACQVADLGNGGRR